MRPKKTPKQAAARVSVLLRGIDNSIASIDKQKKKIADSLKEATGLITGLSNAAVEGTAKPKAPSPKKAATPTPKAKKTAPKAKKTAPKAKKTAPKPKAKKAAVSKAKKAVTPKPKGTTLKDRNPPKEGRPLLKDVGKNLLETVGGPMAAPTIYNDVVVKWGYWSRQSLYNVLRNSDVYRQVGEEYELVNGKPVVGVPPEADDETDQFVKSVAESTGVGQAVSSVQ